MRGLLLLEVLATQSIHAQAVGEGQIRAMEPTLLEVTSGLLKNSAEEMSSRFIHHGIRT